MTIKDMLLRQFKEVINIREHVDTAAADKAIRGNIYFRGPNVWILAFAIVLASVGLNVNSTAVIIGAMLVSPLMGPIFGLGLGLGIGDTALLKASFTNLIIMVGISLVSSFIYFTLTPLETANPTELLARTNPTIYDVIIALFGGFAGIFEQSRKEKGTVFAGVAIATALMPPLCTAGFGLASGNFGYFIGALYLFMINCTFIALATYMTVKYLKFERTEYADAAVSKKAKRIITMGVLIIIIPSIWSAVIVVKENRFEQQAKSFIKENRTIGGCYVYDYHISHQKGSKVELMLSGEQLEDDAKAKLLASAQSHGIGEDQIVFTGLGTAQKEDQSELMKGLFDRTDSELKKKDEEIQSLKQQLREFREKDIPYIQISKEIVHQYPSVKEVSISRGAMVNSSEYTHNECLVLVITVDSLLDEDSADRLRQWMKIRVGEENIRLIQYRSEEVVESAEEETL